MGTCPATQVPENDKQWSFCPNTGAAYFMAILFALTTCAHIAQAIIYRKGYCWVIAMSAAWQTACYVLRILSIRNPASSSFYSGWFILILVSPLWTNAFVYMVMGRMVYNFKSGAKLLGIKAWRFTLYFVILDIIAFIIQIGGAAMASGNNVPKHQILLGLHVYMGGVGFQEFFVLVFSYVAFRLWKQIRQERPARLPQALALLYAEGAALVLITVRIIFRLVEYSSGLNSSIPNHEVYQYIFDSLPMLLALVVFNVVHPGKIMPGKASDFPSRKQRKSYFQNGSPGNSSSPLPTTEPTTGVMKPEQAPVQPQGEHELPSYGYVR